MKTNTTLPEGFVYLNDFDPRIKFDIRYHDTHNIFGRPIKNYNKNIPICTLAAAIALKHAQDDFEQDGYTILVYDAYRPISACLDMVDWTSESFTINAGYVIDFSSRQELFDNNYISDQSSHCRGSTVDLTIIRTEEKNFDPILSYRIIGNRKIPYYNDGSVDMGTSFDFMGPESHSNYPYLSHEQKESRQYFINILKKYGLLNYAVGWEDDPQEWWHFTLANEPFPETNFDFPIE